MFATMSYTLLSVTKRMSKVINIISIYLQRDDNSRLKPGKDTITRNKVKMQQRVLNDTLKNLHLKFCSEIPDLKVSYSKLCKIRPFWVLSPTTKDRDTCMCKLDDNAFFKCSKLQQLGVISNPNTERVIESICCDMRNKECMLCRCPVCKTKRFPTTPFEDGAQVKWFESKSKVCEHNKVDNHGNKEPIEST